MVDAEVYFRGAKKYGSNLFSDDSKMNIGTVDLVFLGINRLENTDFKTGFCGVGPIAWNEQPASSGLVLVADSGIASPCTWE